MEEEDEMRSFLWFVFIFLCFVILQQHGDLVSDVFSCEIRDLPVKNKQKKNLVTDITEMHLRRLLLLNRVRRTQMRDILNLKSIVFMLPIALTKKIKTLTLASTIL